MFTFSSIRVPVIDYVRNSELKREAERIIAFDHSVRLPSSSKPQRTDFSAISMEVKDSLKYARTSKHVIREAKLKERIGIGAFISDNVVPESLHKEVSPY